MADRQAVIALICAKADASGLDRGELLGGAIAESNLDPSARRPTDPSRDQASWPDVSFGLFQQTVRFADEGDHTARADNIRFIQELYFDPAHATDVAARKFAGYRAAEATALDAWCRYNWPAKTPAENPNRANYARGLAEAAQILGDHMQLSDVLTRARSRIGDPYVWGGKAPPATDCSGFVAWCYQGKVTSFTDTIFGETDRVDGTLVAPGDIVLYEYADPDQSGVRFPHVGLYLDDATVLDNRYPQGVGVHPQLARGAHARYYRRLAGVVVDTLGVPPAPVPTPPPAVDPKDDTISGLRIAVAHLADVVVPKAAQAAADREAALIEAQMIRQQFVGPKPA